MDGNGNGNEDGIWEGGGGAKKCKKSHKNCRRDQTRSFRTRHHLCRQEVALEGTRQLRPQGPVPGYVHRTEGVTESEGREGANGGGGGIGVGGGNGDGNGGGGRGGNGDVNGDGDGNEAGAGTGMEAKEGAQDGNGDGSGNEAGTGTRTGIETRGRTQDGNGDRSGDGNESSSGDGNGDEDGNGNENEDGIGEGGGETKKRKEPRKSCIRHVGNGGDFGGERNKRRQERVGLVAANPDNLKNSKEAGGGAQSTQRLGKKCSSRESVSPLSRLIRDFL